MNGKTVGSWIQTLTATIVQPQLCPPSISVALTVTIISHFPASLLSLDFSSIRVTNAMRYKERWAPKLRTHMTRDRSHARYITRTTPASASTPHITHHVQCVIAAHTHAHAKLY